MANEDPTKLIDSFMGPYRFLSNFAVHPDGFSNEHFYQAAKATSGPPKTRLRAVFLARDELLTIPEDCWFDVHRVLSCETPGQAKRAGRRVPFPPVWDDIKEEVMRLLIQYKFGPSFDFGAQLLATGDAELVEGNHWGDTTWGVCRGEGKNLLGKLLMEQRARLRSAS